MKKLIALLTVGTLLVGGFVLSQNNSTVDTAMDAEPTVLSVPDSELLF